MSIDFSAYAEQYGTPLLVLDCQKIVAQSDLLRQALPNVTCYYALKALAHPAVIATLNQCGLGFDIASSGEIELLKRQFIMPRNTIHTHPIKSDAEIVNALRYGCTTFVVDNVYELEKFIPYRHRVGLLLRIAFSDDKAVVNLSKKFGCEPTKANWIIQRARQLNLNIKGLSFHVGSQAGDSGAYVKAINACNRIIEQAEGQGNVLSLVDIGGGFPVNYEQPGCDNIVEFCHPIRSALATLPPHIKVIAEPGRFLVANSMTAVCRVIGKARRNNKNWYYIDDGVYGSFSGQIFDHACYPLHSLKTNKQTYPSVVAGPTCDGIDIIREDILLPELAINDLIIASMMGAYTLASSTNFNGLEKASVLVLNQHLAKTTQVVAFE